MALIVACISLLILILVCLFRVIFGPTIFDKVLSASTIGTASIFLILIHSYNTGRPDFIDLSFVYALLNLVGSVAILKFLKLGDLGSSNNQSGD